MSGVTGPRSRIRNELSSTIPHDPPFRANSHPDCKCARDSKRKCARCMGDFDVT